MLKCWFGLVYVEGQWRNHYNELNADVTVMQSINCSVSNCARPHWSGDIIPWARMTQQVR